MRRRDRGTHGSSSVTPKALPRRAAQGDHQYPISPTDHHPSRELDAEPGARRAEFHGVEPRANGSRAGFRRWLLCANRAGRAFRVGSLSNAALHDGPDTTMRGRTIGRISRAILAQKRTRHGRCITPRHKAQTRNWNSWEPNYSLLASPSPCTRCARCSCVSAIGSEPCPSNSCSLPRVPLG